MQEGDARKDAVKKINKSLASARSTGSIHLTSNLNDEKARGTFVAINVAGVPREPGEDRASTRVYDTNVKILQDSLPAILRNNPDAIFLQIANPVDKLTEKAYEIAKESGINGSHIFGVGSYIDQARYLQHTLDALQEKNPGVVFEKDKLTRLGVVGLHSDRMQADYKNAQYDGRKLVSDNPAENAYFTGAEMGAIFQKVITHGDDYKREIIPANIEPYCRTYTRKTGDGDVQGPVEAILDIVDKFSRLTMQAGNEESITLNSPFLNQNAPKTRTGGWPLKFENIGYTVAVTPEEALDMETIQKRSELITSRNSIPPSSNHKEFITHLAENHIRRTQPFYNARPEITIGSKIFTSNRKTEEDRTNFTKTINQMPDQKAL